jgi:hypothetical protein
MTRDSHPGTVPDIVSDDQVKILLAALYHAADYKRERAETCADCGDQSCITCRRRLQAADAYDRMAAQMREAAEASGTRRHRPRHAAPATGVPHAAANPRTRH